MQIQVQTIWFVGMNLVFVTHGIGSKLPKYLVQKYHNAVLEATKYRSFVDLLSKNQGVSLFISTLQSYPEHH